MAVTLDHTSVPTRDRVTTAQFFARILGLVYEGPRRAFAPVVVNPTLTLNFEEANVFESHHYAFRVDPDEFEGVRARLEAEGVPYGSRPHEGDGQVYEREGVRGLYFDDPNGHGLEVLTRA